MGDSCVKLSRRGSKPSSGRLMVNNAGILRYDYRGNLTHNVPCRTVIGLMMCTYGAQSRVRVSASRRNDLCKVSIGDKIKCKVGIPASTLTTVLKDPGQYFEGLTWPKKMKNVQN